MLENIPKEYKAHVIILTLLLFFILATYQEDNRKVLIIKSLELEIKLKEIKLEKMLQQEYIRLYDNELDKMYNIPVESIEK